MATLGVLAFRNSKINVLQESNSDNIQPISDKREVIVVRKKPKTPSSTVSVSSIINSQQPTFKDTNVERVRKSSKKEPRGQNPPPIAVARRNARERNRVKQVNNGFATLRQHIPNEIAEIYENANNNRTSSKKLSKVETLRMAVEYIRSLENLLKKSEDCPDITHNISFPSPASSESQQNGSSFDQSHLLDDDDSDTPSTFPSMLGHHYVRIPGTNTFQIIPGPVPMGFEDEENVHPMTPNSDMICNEDMLVHPSVMDFSNNPELCAIVQSPEFYSESSLSPNEDVKYVTGDINQHVLYTQSVMIDGHPREIILTSANEVIDIKSGKDLLQSSEMMLENETLVELKQEIDESIENDNFQQGVEESVTENLHWWPESSKNQNGL